MRYFENKKTNDVFGYDETDQSQLALINLTVGNSDFSEITGNFPPLPTLDDIKSAQNAILDASCAAQIVGGITSSALGSAYVYPTQTTDQNNLNANVTSSLLPNLASDWVTSQICQDSAGNWAYVNHTASQIQQVGSDVKSAILNMLIKKTQLQAQVNAAATENQVKLITW